MSLFNITKKAIINAACCDLRDYTPQALSSIRAINAAAVILPKNPSEEFMTAYGSIRIKNIASEVRIDSDKRISTISGIGEINDNSVDYDTVYIISGMVLIGKLSGDKPINIISSGIVMYSKGTKINFIEKSGISTEIDFEIKKTVNFPKDAVIDNRFIELTENGTLVRCGKDLKLADDVREDTLLSKDIFFAVGKDINCKKSISSVVKLKSAVGKDVNSYE